MSTEPLFIDGAMGEGGGQVLRSSLSLAGLTGRAVTLTNIRKNRGKPGLLAQHLTCVKAAARLCDAHVEGAALGSDRLTFTPGSPPRAGTFRFDVGTAGSTTLVLQTVLPLLLVAEGTSRVEVSGGTHNPSAPPFEFLRDSFLPQLHKMGAEAQLELVRAGFAPRGGGRLALVVEGGRPLAPLSLEEAGAPGPVRAVAVLSQTGGKRELPDAIAERELAVVQEGLGLRPSALSVQRVPSAGDGNALLIELPFDAVTEVATAFGKKGRPAEAVAAEAVAAAKAYLDGGAPVGEHLADQLLLPAVLAGGARFVTGPLSRHAETNLEVVRRFVPRLEARVDADGRRVRVDVRCPPLGPAGR